MDIEAPLVATKAEPGQFIILRVDEAGERIPLTVADFDREKGTVTIIFQIVGATTKKLNALNEGDSLHDFVGPLGTPSHVEGLKKVAVVGGGVGCAIAYPHGQRSCMSMGAEVDTDRRLPQQRYCYSGGRDAGGERQAVHHHRRRQLRRQGLCHRRAERADRSRRANTIEVIAIGPLIMMKFVCELTKEYGIKTMVSMNPIMIDGTGMCGGCRADRGRQDQVCLRGRPGL